MKINEFSELTGLTDNDLILCWDAETIATRKVKASTIKSYINAANQQQIVNLSYSSNGDTNGCFYWLGTEGGLQSFSNPAVSGKLLFFPSSLVGGSEICTILSDRSTNNPGFVTNNTANSWIAWDLGSNRKFQYSGYNLRARTSVSFPGGYIRNWKLQGSNNLPSNTVEGAANATWVDLDVKTSNTTINSEGGWGYFSLSSSASYRWARIQQTGVNSSNNNALSLGEIEIYGTLTVN